MTGSAVRVTPCAPNAWPVAVQAAHSTATETNAAYGRYSGRTSAACAVTRNVPTLVPGACGDTQKGKASADPAAGAVRRACFVQSAASGRTPSLFSACSTAAGLMPAWVRGGVRP